MRTLVFSTAVIAGCCLDRYGTCERNSPVQ